MKMKIYQSINFIIVSLTGSLRLSFENLIDVVALVAQSEGTMSDVVLGSVAEVVRSTPTMGLSF